MGGEQLCQPGDGGLRLFRDDADCVRRDTGGLQHRGRPRGDGDRLAVAEHFADHLHHPRVEGLPRRRVAGLGIERGLGVRRGRRGLHHQGRVKLDRRRSEERAIDDDVTQLAAMGRGDERQHARGHDGILGRRDGGGIGVGVDDERDLAAGYRPRAPDLGQRRARLDVCGRRHRRLRCGQAECLGDLGAEVCVDVGQALQLPDADRFLVALAELEDVGPRQMLALHVGQRADEQRRLAEVVVEALGQLPHLRALDALRDVDERAALVVGDGRVAAVERVRAVWRHPAVDGVLVEAVAEHVVDRTVGAVDGDLAEVRPAQAGDLGVDVGEQPHLQQRVVRDVDAGHQVAGVEHHLLHLGEEVGGAAVERHRADDLDWAELLGDDLGGVEQVDALEGFVVAVRHHLHAEVVGRVGAGVDRVVQVATVEVGVVARRHLGLFPDLAVDALLRLPVELHQAGLARLVDEPEGVDAEALHHPVRQGDGPVGHAPGHVRLGLRVEGDEVPERVVRALRLRDLPVGFGLDRVHDVRELDALLDEEDGDVVADEVVVAL